MFRLSAFLLVILLVGCQDKGKSDEPVVPAKPIEPVDIGEVELTLLLPAYVERPDRDPPRLFQLKIEGKDFTAPKAKEKKVVTVRPAKGKDVVEIVLSFYPVSYSKTIRTKQVKLEKGKSAEVDLRTEDPTMADRLEPIYFPAAASLMEAMNKLANVTPADTVMDIGCGDGRLVIAAVKKFGAKKGIGIDIQPELVQLCKDNAKKEGVADETEFSVQDALKLEDVSHVSVVFLYVGEDLGRRLQPLLQKTLKPGARVVALDYPVGNWPPDKLEKITAKNDSGADRAYELRLWTVKAK